MPSIYLRFIALNLFSILTFSGAALAENYVVTSSADSGAGTLRQAILDANATPEKDSIVFDLPGVAPHILWLSTPLPEITQTVDIDGSGDVVLDGSGVGIPADGLRLIDTKRSSISGLTIRGFTNALPCDELGLCSYAAGIRIQGNSSRNVISDNRVLGSVYGILLASGASDNAVTSNFIDGEVGTLEPQGGDPLTDEAFRTNFRGVNGLASYGILLARDATDNRIEENHAQRIFRGYTVVLSDQNQLNDNVALAVGNQCYLIIGNDNVVSDNSCELTRREAFEIFGSPGLTVSSGNRFVDNHASRSGYGDPNIGQLLIQGGTDNVMEDNTLSDNFSYGIALFGPSARNVLRSNDVNGSDRAAIRLAGAPDIENVDNVFAENSLQNYSRTSEEGAIFVQGASSFNFFFENYVGLAGGTSPSAIQVHERTGVLWLFDSGTSDNAVCEPKLINAALDVGSQLVTPPGLGNGVFEECSDVDD